METDSVPSLIPFYYPPCSHSVFYDAVGDLIQAAMQLGERIDTEEVPCRDKMRWRRGAR